MAVRTVSISRTELHRCHCSSWLIRSCIMSDANAVSFPLAVVYEIRTGVASAQPLTSFRLKRRVKLTQNGFK